MLETLIIAFGLILAGGLVAIIALLLRRNGFKDDTPQIAGNCSNCRKLIWADEKYDYYPDDDMWYCMSCSGKVQNEGE